MINLEKIKGKVSPPPFKKTYPCTILPGPSFNFSDSPPSGVGNQNLLPPSHPTPLKKRGGRGPNYVT